ncbi:hypothetical protein BDZ91DRAFT_709300 [Kalaharituber pfeilii]|nr:hypothetical protein BDZ91DRAFT_709300 [Kalaharituber pfeilii]
MQSTASHCLRPTLQRCSLRAAPLRLSRIFVPYPRLLSTSTAACAQRIPKRGLRPTANFPPEGGNSPREVFSELNVLSGLPEPASGVDSIFPDGFSLNNGREIRGDGVFLLNNEVFRWKALLSEPKVGNTGALNDVTELSNASQKAKKTGLLEFSNEVWGLLDVVYPKPDLLILGTGHRTLLLHPNSRKRIQEMGISLDVMDTHNAAAQYNLLATERPGAQVAAALLPAGFGAT